MSKEHYGIHGTDEPSRIGRAESNGCIRLTNWDAARLAQMVEAGHRSGVQGLMGRLVTRIGWIVVIAVLVGAFWIFCL